MKKLLTILFFLPLITEAQLSSNQLKQVNNLIASAVTKLNTANASQDSKILTVSARISTLEANAKKDSLIITNLQSQLNDLLDMGVNNILADDKRDSAIVRSERKNDSLQNVINQYSVLLDSNQFTIKNKIATITLLQSLLDRMTKVEAKLP
jgi:hypothetical protein